MAPRRIFVKSQVDKEHHRHHEDHLDCQRLTRGKIPADPTSHEQIYLQTVHRLHKIILYIMKPYNSLIQLFSVQLFSSRFRTLRFAPRALRYYSVMNTLTFGVDLR